MPRMKSGSESGIAQHRRQILHRSSADERAEPLVGERVEEAAEQRAVARAGAAEHDHHEQRQREVRGRHLRATRRPMSEQPDDAADGREERREHERRSA